ncbi:MAG: hypothetical protein H7145_11920 [Akkermansiaceae bacterium]|nr:hypothetical protein [Armatimonadota bacterium]
MKSTTPIGRSSLLFALLLFAPGLGHVGCARPAARAASAKAQTAIGTEPMAPPRFAVSVAAGKLPPNTAGRLMIVLDAGGDVGGDLRSRLGDVEEARDGAAFGMDATFPGAASVVRMDTAKKTVRSFNFFHDNPGEGFVPGTYRVQAVFAHNPDFQSPDAPGNLYSEPRTVTLPSDKPVALTLSEVEPEEAPPAETAAVKWVKIRSEPLSKFYKRPIFLRAGVVLPPEFSLASAKPYPLCVRVGGFNTRYTAASRVRPHPGIVQVTLDGDGPFGDSYSTDSAVAGPYGEATVRELLPAIEKRFRCGGAAARRFTTGGSTGGWVSLALQVYYPDTFGGCWSGYPDPLDFSAYQNIDLYRDANAYTAPDGSERVSARDARTGATRWTVREECALENVRGRGGSYVTSGGQWGAWNAVYGSPDASGRPVPFWDPVSGKINRAAADNAGKQYDLRRYCEKNWKTLAPKLDGKLHIWVGERDEYFLNGGVHRFDDFLKTASPKITARVEYSATDNHGWEPRPRSAVLDEMIAASK